MIREMNIILLNFQLNDLVAIHDERGYDTLADQPLQDEVPVKT